MILIPRIHFGAVDPLWFRAYEQLIKPAKPDGSPNWMTMMVQRSVIDIARNTVVQRALTVAPVDADDAITHVFFLDDDVLPPPDALLRLLAADVPIISGFYVGRIWPHYPTAGRSISDGADAQCVPITEFCDGVQEVDAVPAGCLLVKREVFEHMAPPWFGFQYGASLEDTITEDYQFCYQAKQLGYPILLDFDVQCKHLTTIAVGYQHWCTAWGSCPPESRQKHFGGIDLTRDFSPKPWRPATP